MTANPAATTTATCSASSSAPVASAPVMVRSRPVIGAVELAELNDRFETAPPEEIVQWAAARFGHRLATMDDDAYEAYIADHDVLVNTLQLDGYASIGCWPCTEPSIDGRAGRWGGTKTECGSHL